MPRAWLEVWLLRPQRLMLVLLLIALALCLLVGQQAAQRWTVQRQQELIASAAQRLTQRIRHVEQELQALLGLRGRLHERQMQAQQRALQALNRELAEQALSDALTGCANRRALLQRLDEELQRRRRVAHPLCLAMIDIDHFKSVNDRF
ncbi:MAG: GGDEF domain-containing protein, partial [Inhella sp.]